MSATTLPRRPSLRVDIAMRPLPPPPPPMPATGSSASTSSTSATTTLFTTSPASAAYTPPSAYLNNSRPLPQRPRIAPRGMRTKRSRSASDSRAQIAFDAQTGSWVVMPHSKAHTQQQETMSAVKVEKGKAPDKGKAPMHPRIPLPIATSASTPPVPPTPITPLSIRKHSASRSRARPTPPEYDLNVLSRAHIARKLMVHNPDDEAEDEPPLHKHVIVEYGSESSRSDKEADKEKERNTNKDLSDSSDDPSLFRSYVDILPVMDRSPSPMQFGRRGSLDSIESLGSSPRRPRHISPPLSPLLTGPAPSPRIEDQIVFSDNPSPTVEDFDDELLDIVPRRRRGRQRARSLSPSSTYAPSSYAPSSYAPSTYAPSTYAPSLSTHAPLSSASSFDRERLAPSVASRRGKKAPAPKQPVFDPERFAPLQSLAPYTVPRGRDSVKKPRPSSIRQ